METKTSSSLEQLKQYTKVVADTGDFESIKAYEPQDATTNPSLILAAVEKPEYSHLLDKAVADNKDKGIRAITIDLLTLFGGEILKIVPGRVSTEVDARLSFDAEASVAMAHEIIALYESRGISRERILIKLASTWEGVKAAEALKKDGINCNMTLMFNLGQAIACAQVGAQLISPFVGRIYDYYVATTGKDYQEAEDPGVQSVTQIYNYYKKFGYDTEVMGASFRNTGEITHLAGCDLLTISPKLLKLLAESDEVIEKKLDADAAKGMELERIEVDEKVYRWMLNDDPMANDKLADGIRRFAKDIDKLEGIIQSKLG